METYKYSELDQKNQELAELVRLIAKAESQKEDLEAEIAAKHCSELLLRHLKYI